MIIYNIRANGPFEYDKFILNIGQLYNACNAVKHEYSGSGLKEKMQELDDNILQYTQEDNLLNQLSLLKKAVTE